MAWSHFSSIPKSPIDGDARCTTAGHTDFAFITSGDYDGDGRDEIVVGIDHHLQPKTLSNDLWALKFDGNAFQHMCPLPLHPLDADIDCSAEDIKAAWAVSGDFDGDGRAEIAVRPYGMAGTEGNDLWVQRFVPDQPGGPTAHFEAFAMIPGHWFGASIDCSVLPFEAGLMAAGDFDGDGRDELVIGNQESGSAGNDFWVQKWDPGSGAFYPMDPIFGHPMEASIDCSALNFRAHFLVVGDFDGDGADEIAVAIDRPGTEGNDFWVQKWYPGGFQTMGLIPGHPLDASIDCSVADRRARFAVSGDFDGDGCDEIAVAVDSRHIYMGRTEGNDFWVQKWDPHGSQFVPLSVIPGHYLDASIDCSAADLSASFAVVGDFDGDRSDELVIFVEDRGSLGNDAWAQKLVAGSFEPFDPIPGPIVFASLDCSPGPVFATMGVAGRFSADERYAVAVLPSSPARPELDFWVMSSCLAQANSHSILGGRATISHTNALVASPLGPLPFSLSFDLNACTRRSGSVTAWFLAPMNFATCPLPVVGPVPNTVTTKLVNSWSFRFSRIDGSMSFWLKLLVSHSAPIPASEIDVYFDTATVLAPPFVGVPLDPVGPPPGSISLVGTGSNVALGNVTVLLSGRVAPLP
jgi:hypothetical protein